MVSEENKLIYTALESILSEEIQKLLILTKPKLPVNLFMQLHHSNQKTISIRTALEYISTIERIM